LKKKNPPNLPLRFFRWFCHPKLRDSIEGDLMELYEERVKEKGKLKADFSFILDVLLLFRPGIIKPAEGYQQVNTYGMYKNYFIAGVRVFLKQKVFSLINVVGLALGIASVFLMAMYVQYELGYDRYYDQPENLYRITWGDNNPHTRTPHPMAQAMVTDFAEVENAVSLSPLWGSGLTRRTISFRNPDKDVQFDEAGVLAVDTTFFDVFRFPVVQGDAKNALKNVNGLLISESTAQRYFGAENPIGKHLTVNSENVLLEVMAVFKDVPPQSHFHFDMLISYVREKSFNPEDEYYSWADFGHFNYVRLKPGTDPKEFEAKLMPWIGKYIDTSKEDFRNAIAHNFGFRVQPVTDIHLKSKLRWELEPNGNIEYVYIMAGAALFILVIACINFINLITAKSAERAKEIGIRKSLGAVRGQLSVQFFAESFIVTSLSVLMALLLIQISVPFYNSLTGHFISLNYFQVVPVLIAFGIIIAIIASFYPSIRLASLQPHLILKGKIHRSSKGVELRSGLIVLQFAISMILISGSVIIYRQLEFIQSKNLGFDREQVLVIPLKEKRVAKRLQELKAELLKIDGVKSVSASSNLPGGQFNQNSISLDQQPNHKVSCSEVFVDYDFFKTMNIELADGRFFEPENLTDSSASFVINETAARQLQTSSVVGQEIHWHAYENDSFVKGRVIGVVKDFHYQSLHQSIQPLVLVLYPAYNHLVIKLNPDDFENKIAHVKNVYSQFDETYDFEFSFLDERLNQQYKSEQHSGTVFGLFAFLAVVIACFGLFGMAIITFNQRIKEVSIHKIMGASIPNLIRLLLSDFTKLISIAILIAAPVAWWIMTNWLNNFTYRVSINAVIFVVSGFTLLIVAWVTLSYFTIKTARVNPAQTLRNE